MTYLRAEHPPEANFTRRSGVARHLPLSGWETERGQTGGERRALEAAQLYVAELESSGLIGPYHRELDKHLERFATPHYNGLRHILSGDGSGGGHHKATLEAMGGYTVSETAAAYPAGGAGDRRAVPDEYSVTGYPEVVTSFPENGRTRRVLKEGYTKFFPEVWSVEDVAHAVLTVAGTGPAVIDERRGMHEHVGKFSGVMLRVVTAPVLDGPPKINHSLSAMGPNKSRGKTPTAY